MNDFWMKYRCLWIKKSSNFYPVSKIVLDGEEDLYWTVFFVCVELPLALFERQFTKLDCVLEENTLVLVTK